MSIHVEKPAKRRVRAKALDDAFRHQVRKRGTSKYAFITVTDYQFFPGTLATINSVLEFHPKADIFVVNNDKQPLVAVQKEILRRHKQVRLIDSRCFAEKGWHIDPWALKAYATHDLCDGYAVIILIDSDCLLCSAVDEEIDRCLQTGGFLGGKDGEGVDYDRAYHTYGIETPCRNPKYMSTSLVFCAVNIENKRILRKWVECCGAAEFNGTGLHPGHGDQGVLNALLFAANQNGKVELLDNRLWSQHWVYWDSIIVFRAGVFLNRSAEYQKQRVFHCGGAEKFWTLEHRDRVLDSNPAQIYPYVWFLTMFWFGTCRNWNADPFDYLPPESHHLVEDLANFLPEILEVCSRSKEIWSELTHIMMQRILHSALCFNSPDSSLTEAVNLIEAHPSVRCCVEIGGYEDGSILALALRFLNRDMDFYCVDSDLRNLGDTMNSCGSPSRGKSLTNLAKCRALRLKLVLGQPGLAASLFADASVDLVFIYGCHDSSAVLRDINNWLPKISSGGIIAGDGYSRLPVKQAVCKYLPKVDVTPSGLIWWKRL